MYQCKRLGLHVFYNCFPPVKAPRKFSTKPEVLAVTPPRATNQVSSKPEVLDLTQIAFGSDVRDRLEEAGEH